MKLEQTKKVIQAIFDRSFSKKLFAFLIATMLLWFGKITENIWEMITITYLSAQAAYDTAITWKHGSKKEVKKYAVQNFCTAYYCYLRRQQKFLVGRRSCFNFL